MAGPLSAAEAVPVAEFRAALRGFMRTSERNARAAGLTPQRYLLLLMIKGAPDGSEQSTVTDLAAAAAAGAEHGHGARQPGRGDRPGRTRALERRRPHRLPPPHRRGGAAARAGVHEQPARAPRARPGVRAPPVDRLADVGSGRARRDLLLPHLKRLRREGRESRDRAECRRLRGRGGSREQRAVRRDRRRKARLLESRDRPLPGRRRGSRGPRLGAFDETVTRLPSRAGRPEAASSVAPVPHGTNAPCVLASERPSRPESVHRSVKDS